MILTPLKGKGVRLISTHLVLLMALWCSDPDLRQRVTPAVGRMGDQRLALGDKYQQGENFNRAAILGLLLMWSRSNG